MNRFAFIIHPLDVSDVSRKFSWTKYLPDKVVEQLLRRVPPFSAAEITGVRSAQGQEVEGWFVTCPLTARQMLKYPEDYVLEKIIKTCQKAEGLGADIIGLGAFTSVVGDKGLTVSKAVDTPITTGNSYTVATALESTLIAVGEMGLDIEEEKVSVIGATGSIGSACCKMLADKCLEMNLLARNKDKLYEVAQELMDINPDLQINVYLEGQIPLCLHQSRVVLTASGAASQLIQPEMLQSGSVICDVARPRDVAKKVGEKRNDVLIIEGGVVRVPGPVNFNLNFGFPPGTSYACMAETMILALEGRFEPYSLGSELELDKVEEISRLAGKHGFELAGLRSFERALTTEALQQIRNRAAEVV